MPTIRLNTTIHAPIEVCFDLARSIDAHQESASQTKEKAIAGKTSGLCELNDVITWEAVHFGIRQKLTVKITTFNKPHSFTDEMRSGAFAAMKHVHAFKREGDATVMHDEFTFAAPLGILGRIAERLFLTAYMTRFLKTRNAVLKELAEKKTT